jgi:hypothetical protein
VLSRVDQIGTQSPRTFHGGDDRGDFDEIRSRADDIEDFHPNKLLAANSLLPFNHRRMSLYPATVNRRKLRRWRFAISPGWLLPSDPPNFSFTTGSF